ncbi:2-oxoglutarate and iron-dependent oxygenase domain-containing protein 3 [Anabrus simplex]|uniref:2-oxoglutarate and iron-dependent oxygenase domain-containing protein 3 n=1 Tax=Anabrus simplex TaxID=316456 RepID=UPI0034DD43D6
MAMSAEVKHREHMKRRGDSNGKGKPTKSDSKENLGKKKEVKEDKSDQKGPKYGPLPKIPYQQVWARGVMILGVIAVVYFSTKNNKEVALARQKEILHQRAHDIPCSEDYKTEIKEFPGCVPERCGRLVSDKLVSASEADALLNLAQRGLALGGSDGGASILDLHSGAISMGQGFVNVYQQKKAANIFQKADFTIYKVVKTKIQHAVAHHFGLDVKTLRLTHPTFFSRMTSLPPKTIHDEYWHPHVDKETYKSFHYTSLLYLTDYGRDFEGGRFIFIDQDKTNRTVEPRKGRVSMFTSGSENVHFVERVTSGTRFALTVSFTCDPQYEIQDPSFHVADK